MTKFEDNHPIHGLLIGAGTYALTKNSLLSAGIGGGLFMYMKKFGHGLPTDAEPEPPRQERRRQPTNRNIKHRLDHVESKK